jgi:hypothetical protein
MRIDCAVVFIGVTLKKTSLARQAESPQPRITASSSQKRSQLFIRTHKETLSVAAVCICNPDCSPFAINR